MSYTQEQIQGGMLGLLIGDALGVPYEFHWPEDLPPSGEIEFTPPRGFQRAHAGTPPGTWSDDGAQALALLASLLACEGFDAEDFGRKLVAWYDEGFMAVDGRVFDIGIQTTDALHALRKGAPALSAGRTDERANGNGSLMRVLPLALWHRGSDEELIQLASLQSRVTHGHLRSQVGCALYCLWARYTAAGAADPWNVAVAVLHGLYGEQTPERAELELYLRSDNWRRGSGYVVDCLRSARWAVEQGDYEQVVRAAVALGHDADTTACVSGGIAGLRDGLKAIPERWRRNLRGQELALPLIQRLTVRHCHQV